VGNACACGCRLCVVDPLLRSSDCVESPPTLSPMAPYDFNAPDADAILCSSDRKELRVHKVIISLASPVFRDMFSLPQPVESPSKIPSIDIPESSDILQPLIQHLYPYSPPEIPDVEMWAKLHTTADKYNIEVVMDWLEGMLIPRFLKTSPLRVYALASCWGFEEEAKIASRGTLTIDISNGFPEEDARLMGGVACQKIYVLHTQRREQTRALIGALPYRFSGNCSCPPMNFQPIFQRLNRCLSTEPWISSGELYEEAAGAEKSQRCPGNCRNAFKNVHAWISSILKEMSKLPQTI
jgi:hypothetical protein